MILWTKLKFYILYKKHNEHKDKESDIMVRTIEKHIDEIFNLLYGSKKNNKGEYWADVYKDALGSKDNGFYELFASYDKAVLKNNLFAYAQTIADLILIGEDLYIGNEKLVKANIAANGIKLLNLCKKMVKEWAVS